MANSHAAFGPTPQSVPADAVAAHGRARHGGAKAVVLRAVPAMSTIASRVRAEGQFPPSLWSPLGTDAILRLQRTHGNAHVQRRLATIKAGAHGPDVRALQERLNAATPRPEPLLVTDGHFGPKTEAAVVAFQRGHGLAADGIVGRQTGAVLAGGPSDTASVTGAAADPKAPVADEGAPATGTTDAQPGARDGTAQAAAGGDWSKKLRRVKKGMAAYAGDKLETTLRRLLKEQGGSLHVEGRTVALSEEEIGLLQGVAQVETGGLTNGINSWDSDVMSMGFMQYTMAGKLQDLIRRAPTAFAKYGIRLGGELTLTSKKGMKVVGIEGVASDVDLRGPDWGARFLEAGLDPEIIAAQVERAKEHDLPKVAKQVGRLPIKTDRVQRIILELHNNRPAYVKPVVDRTIAKVGESPTEDEFIAVLKSAMQDVYAERNANGVNGKTETEARAKAARIVDKNK